MKRVADPQAVCVGTHGVMIRSGLNSGLLLPQVATEQGWDREMFSVRCVPQGRACP